MCLPLTDKGHQLLQHLLALPPRLEEAGELLQRFCLPAEEVTKTGIRYLEECFYEVSDWAWQSGQPHPEAVVPGLHSTQVCEVLMLLLKFGLDPNAVYRNENIMDAARSIDNEYLAADALALLFEHGGDPNLLISGAPMFEDMELDLRDCLEEESARLLDARVHCWMVGLAYGGKGRARTTDVCFDPALLRSHRNYGFRLDREARDLLIFERSTSREVRC